MPAAFRELIEALQREVVAFAVIGGVALISRGSARTTNDLDICYARDRENLERLARALGPLHPRLRGAPESLPFRLDAATLQAGLNFTLECDWGPIDLLGEVTGLGGYDAVLSVSSTLTIFGIEVPVLTLDGLEKAKTAAGRLRDALDIAEIREIRNQRERNC